MSRELEEIASKVAKSPDNLLYRFSFAQKLSAQGQNEEAIEQLEECVAQRGDWMIAFLLKAKLEIGLDKKSDAISSLQKTIELAKVQAHDDPLLEAQELLGSLLL